MADAPKLGYSAGHGVHGITPIPTSGISHIAPQRTPLFIGNRELVKKAEELIREYS